jgi:heme/copper-type cytochrome/quinol oxidase subunit 4
MIGKRSHLIPSLIAALMLFGALGRWPYGYYQLLRFVVCGVSVYVAFMAYNWQKIWAVWLFGFIAFLFNPLIPMHISRELWQPIDFICAVVFIIVAVVLKMPSKETDNKNESKV